MDEEVINPETLIATFQSLSAEGDLLLQKGAFGEAIQIYTKAIEIRPTDKHCLVCRARCYIQIGAARHALQDANTSLKEDPNYYKGIYLKAEALYAEGDFELALLYFHRGNKLRPELYEFRVGILKSREAINNSIGDPKKIKIHVPNRLRKLILANGEQKEDREKAPEERRPYYTPAKLSNMMEGKLLEDLLRDKDFVDFPDEKVTHLVNNGLQYLRTRVGFWRQQLPLYARPREPVIIPRLTRGKVKPVLPNIKSDVGLVESK
ncbi:Tetratricopeptide repeat protein 25 [Globomyces sp. JEL0801]|nr:Tetratricopeptide repeat protein 25 [Globomyces sp. JEL0801]